MSNNTTSFGNLDPNARRPNLSGETIVQERRSYFRINQDVIFEYRSIDVHTAQNDEPEQAMGGGAGLDLIGELRRIDREAQQSLKILANKNRILGDYLQRMSQKIDLIARFSVFAHTPDSAPSRINLSEGGLAFKSDRTLYKGNFLVLRLIFLPTYTPVVVFANVTRCDPYKNGYQIAAQFHRLRDEDRQALAREILKSQVQARRRHTLKETVTDESKPRA